jgi:hypothetical protein
MTQLCRCISGRCHSPATATGLCEACQTVADLGGECGLPYDHPNIPPDDSVQFPDATIVQALNRAAEEDI